MKRQSSPLPRAEDADYTLHPQRLFPYWTLNEGARRIGITPQRMSRLLRILEIPVHRRGYTIFLDDGAINRVSRAIKKEEVKPGRKRKSELATD